MSVQDANIVQVFVVAANRWPAATALIQDGQAVTYLHLLDEVISTAALYSSKGIKTGDRVLVLVPMSPDLYCTVLALFYLGATPVFLDAWVNGKRLEECCNIAACTAMIASPKLYWLSLLFPVLRRLPIRIHINEKRRPGAMIPPATVAGHDVALVTFTTGSTGTPKAAARTHTFLRAQLAALTPLMSSGQDRTLTTLPIVVLLALALNKTVVLPPKGFKATRPRHVSSLAGVVQANKVNSIIVSPALMEALTAYHFPELKFITTGGGAVFPFLASRISERYPQATARAVYGSTEAEPISSISAQELAPTTIEQLKAYGLPVGRPSSDIAVAIIPFEQGGSVNATQSKLIQCPVGVAGEIVVAGAHVLDQYLNANAPDPLKKIKVGDILWHRTGDAGRLLGDGSLYFLGRCREVIYWQGRELFPLIQCYCFKLESGVQEAALLQQNQRLLLVVESPAPLPEPLLQKSLAGAALQGALVRYMKHIPKDPRHNTKVDYLRLEKLLAK